MALLLLHRALQQDVPADAPFYGAVLESCAAAKRWQIAVQLLEELGGDDVVCSLYLRMSCIFMLFLSLFLDVFVCVFFGIYGSQYKTLHSCYLGRTGQYVERFEVFSSSETLDSNETRLQSVFFLTAS